MSIIAFYISLIKEMQFVWYNFCNKEVHVLVFQKQQKIQTCTVEVSDFLWNLIYLSFL